jgi:hypothetical protein
VLQAVPASTQKSDALIQSGAARTPFSHSWYPVGGFENIKKATHAFIDNISDGAVALHDTDKPLTCSTTSASTVAPISDIMTPASSSLSTTTGSSVKSLAEKIGSNDYHHRSSSDKISQFLTKIPDLSYMLSSKLSLPGK